MTDYNKTKCPICGKLLGELRLKRYPSAKTCGFEVCMKQYRHESTLAIRRRHFAKRYARDPVFREKQRAIGREQYRLKRLAAGKIVTPQARPAADRGAFGTFIRIFSTNPLGALTRGARAVRSICG